MSPLYLVCGEDDETMIDADTPEAAIDYAINVADLGIIQAIHVIPPTAPNYQRYLECLVHEVSQ